VLKKILPVAVSAVAVAALAACGSSSGAAAGASGAGAGGGDKIVMGFAQVGAESGWRTANTKNVQESAKTAGIELKFSDAQQKQENQIKAIRAKRIVTHEGVFPMEVAAKEFPNRKY
jgi:simple sugar transport system substrate-binding protein